MSILKQIQEGTALLEVSKALLGRYINKAEKSAASHDDISNEYHRIAKKQHDGMDQLSLKHMWKADDRRQNIDKAKKKLAKEETELGEEHMKKRGRPKKARHEDGKIVNDPEANS